MVNRSRLIVGVVIRVVLGAIHKGRPQLGGGGGVSQKWTREDGGGGGGGLGQNEDVLKKSQFSTILW